MRTCHNCKSEVDVDICPVCGTKYEFAPSAGSLALDDVLEERRRQEAKWGEQNHDPFTYIAILTEEVGELSQAALHDRFGGPAAVKLRDEAVQVAAVALAIVECLDRAKWSWPENDQAHLRVGGKAE